jgi:hypothetical protein
MEDKKLFVIISAGMDKGIIASRVAIEKGMDINDIVVIEKDSPEDLRLLKDRVELIEVKPPEPFVLKNLRTFDEPFIEYSDNPYLKSKKCRAKDTTKTLAKRRAKNKQAKKSRAKNRKK